MNEIKTFEDYQKAYKQSIEDPAGFWGTVAEQFTWRKKWDKVFHWESDLTKVEWFIGGKLNITENCLDRHLERSPLLSKCLSKQFSVMLSFPPINHPTLVKSDSQ